MSQNAPTFITIPGTTAAHVVGSSTVDIGSGDLTLVPASAASHTTTKTTLLTLTVGAAAFPLYSTTTFGTVAGDERIYVFRPELGEDIKGYVRIALPEGVHEPGSEFQVLQAQFEKILIDRGLLNPGEGPNERTVSVPSTTAIHVLGETSVEIARGDLTLATLNTSNEKLDKDKRAVLTLRVGEAAFPLHRTTLFGVLIDNERTYAFKPEIGSTAERGFVKLILPEEVTSDTHLSNLQEQFEQILIDYGLLKEGVEAVGDELGRSVREGATSVADSIRQSKSGFLAENPPTTSPTTYSPITHDITDGAASATRTLYTAAQSFSSSLSSAASSAGAWLSTQLGPVSPDTAESLNTLGNAYNAAASGITAGTADVKDAASEAAGDVVQNEFGVETRDVGARVAETVGNFGGAVGQVTESVPTAAVSGVKGAVQEDRRMEEDIGTFKIQEDSEEWKDVSM